MTVRWLRGFGLMLAVAVVVACRSSDPVSPTAIVPGDAVIHQPSQQTPTPDATSVFLEAPTQTPSIAPSTDSTPGDAATPEPTATTGLGIGLNISYEYIPDLEHLTWSSAVIIYGEIVAELPSTVLYGGTISSNIDEPSDNYSDVYTDYVVRVFATYRGESAGEYKVRRVGGTVDGVTVTNHTDPEFRIGDRAVFFLEPAEPESEQYGGAFWMRGGSQGRWQVSDGVAIAAVGTEFGPVTLNDLAKRLAAILASPPPSDLTDAPGPNTYVPLDAAPPGEDLPE